MTDPFIPYSTQDIDEADIEAVCAVLRSPFVTQGPAIERFETAIADYCQVPYAVAVSSGTAALHVMLAALDVGQGSLVWTSPITFAATANAARMLSAGVDFVDIDPMTGNLDPGALAKKLDTARRNDHLPDVLIAVHYTGRSADMAAIAGLCRAYDVTVIEDAAHALGARHADGAAVGSCHDSAACMFSLHPVKAITTGEGGVITTRDARLADRMNRLRSHGVSRDSDGFLLPAHDCEVGGWFYQQLELGFNYRLTDIQAALGASQMRRLEQFLTARRRLARRYADILQNLPVILPPASNRSAWHLYVIRLADDAKVARGAVYESLRAAGIGANVHYIPVHWHPYYADLGFRRGDFPVAEAFYRGALSLPLYPKLTDAKQDRVADGLRQALFSTIAAKPVSDGGPG